MGNDREFWVRVNHDKWDDWVNNYAAFPGSVHVIEHSAYESIEKRSAAKDEVIANLIKAMEKAELYIRFRSPNYMTTPRKILFEALESAKAKLNGSE